MKMKYAIGIIIASIGIGVLVISGVIAWLALFLWTWCELHWSLGVTSVIIPSTVLALTGRSLIRKHRKQ